MQVTKHGLAVALAAAFCLTLLGSPAYGAEKYYLQIEGVKQGAFKGSVKRNRSSWIEVAAFSAGAITPRDASTGQASGKRQHKPISITKEVDESSPQLFQAATTNEVLKNVVIQSVRVGPHGKEQVYQTITLKNAHIPQVKKIPGKGKQEQERFEFIFQEIQVTDIQGKTTATDDWTASK
jgi:type VI secretion system secreted protein Hcp